MPALTPPALPSLLPHRPPLTPLPQLPPSPCRPLNRILVAQHVVQPQAWIACLVAAQHVAAARAAVRALGDLGGAYAAVWSTLLSTLLLAGYVVWARLQERVWDSPPGTPWSPWPPYLRASYGACVHAAAATWPACLCSIAAGWLPRPEQALAAMAVASACAGTLAAGYHALAAATCTRCVAGGCWRQGRNGGIAGDRCKALHPGPAGPAWPCCACKARPSSSAPLHSLSVSTPPA